MMSTGISPEIRMLLFSKYTPSYSFRQLEMLVTFDIGGWYTNLFDVRPPQ